MTNSGDLAALGTECNEVTKYINSGNEWVMVPSNLIDVKEVLPPKNYTVMFNPEKDEYSLMEASPFNIGKLYGDVTKKAEHILNTFEDRPNATGVLLSGEKGCGKSLLAKRISILGLGVGIPTIIIDQPYCGPTFNQFIQSIDQPCIVLLDEYEKVYRKMEEQDMMLSLLDGVYPTKKLFILTTNDKWAINSNMMNRPGRLYYALDYKGLDRAFIEDYCNDQLKNKKNTKGIIQLTEIFESFNFDMLKAIVEEMNRYDETASEVLDLLNIKPEGSKKTYKIEAFFKGKSLTINTIREELNPFSSFWIEGTRGKETYWNVVVNPSNDLVEIKQGNYKYRVYNNQLKGEMEVTLTKEKKASSFVERAYATIS